MNSVATFRQFLAGLVILLPVVAIGESDDPYLATLSITRATDATAPLGDSVTLNFHVNDPGATASALSNIDGLEVLSTDAESVQLLVSPTATAAAGVDEKYTQSTFVIDFDEPPVASLQESVRQTYKSGPNSSDLARFVFHHISDKNYMRSFDFASRVAETGAGDCSEHAVLLAALARANGFYARVILGTVIIETDENLRAYGHAWTEIHDGAAWRIEDATMATDQPEPLNVRYIPVSILRDEGPGYAFDMMRGISSMPKRITGVANR